MEPIWDDRYFTCVFPHRQGTNRVSNRKQETAVNKRVKQMFATTPNRKR